MSARVPPPSVVSPASKPTQPAQPFKALLEEARRAATPVSKQRGPSTPAPSSGAAAPKATATSVVVGSKVIIPSTTKIAANSTARAEQTTFTTARAQVDAEAKRLETVRAHHSTISETATVTRAESTAHSEDASSSRLVELIVKELVDAFETKPGGPAHSKVGNPVQPMIQAAELPFAAPPQRQVVPEARAAQAVALIERIDTFVKSQRPALALTLNNSLGARVEIEKLGPGRIALRLVGQNGPPSAESVSRIREELSARGLKIGALSVA